MSDILNKNEKIEKELPLALRMISTELSIGIPLDECLKHLCDGFGELSKEFQTLTREIDNGGNFKEVLHKWGYSKHSKDIEMVVNQLISNYENKEDPTSIERLSSELMAKRKLKLKERSRKIVVYSIIFITISAVLPALFQTFVVVGTTFMDFTISPEQAFIIPVIVFPVLDLIVLLLAIRGGFG